MLDSRNLGLSLMVNYRMWPHLVPPLHPQPLRPLALLAHHQGPPHQNLSASISPTTSANVNQHPVHQFPEFSRETASSPTPTEGKLNYSWRKWRCNDSFVVAAMQHSFFLGRAKNLGDKWAIYNRYVINWLKVYSKQTTILHKWHYKNFTL